MEVVHMAWCEIAGMHCAIIIHRAAYAYSMHSCTVRSCSFVTALVAHTQLVYIQLHACPCTTCAKYIICRHMHYICAHVILQVVHRRCESLAGNRCHICAAM